MGKSYKKRKNYKRVRTKGRSKRDNVERKHLEKLEKAKKRRNLKVNIKLRLKKLIRLINLNSQHLSNW